MPDTNYYPPVSSLITLDDLPESLQFFKDAISTIFSNLYYRNYQGSVSPTGDSAFHKLVLIPPGTDPLEFDVPGDLFTVRLTPPSGGTDPGIDCSIRFAWPILRYLRNVDFSDFDFSMGFFERVLAAAVTITGPEFLAAALESFYGNPVSTSDVTDLVNDLNQNLSIPTPDQLTDPTSPTVEERIADLTDQIETNAYLAGQDLDLQRAIFHGVVEQQTIVEVALVRLYYRWIGHDPIQFVLDLIEPQIYASLAVALSLEFPEEILTPVDDQTLEPIDGQKATLSAGQGEVIFSSESGITFEASGSLTMPLCRIGNSDFYLKIDKAKLDLSTTSNLAGAGEYGLPNSFVGAHIQEVEFHFPKFWEDDQGNPNTAVIRGENLFVGTGGITGRVMMEATTSTDPLIYLKWGDFALVLKEFSLDFFQNSIVGSSISAMLTIPGIFGGAPQDVDVKIVISDTGFEVTGTPENLVLGCTDPMAANCISYEVKTISLGQSGSRFYIETTGTLNIRTDLPVIGNLIDQELEIKRLRIWSDGTVDFDGGSLVLPTSVSINAGPVELSVTALHIGTYEGYVDGQLRQYTYIGFDGGVKSGPGGFDVRGNGIKYYFTTDGGTFDHFLKIAGIAIDIIIPGGARPEDATAIIEGFLSLSNPETDPGPNPNPEDFNAAEEFAGGVSITLPQLDMAGGASMRIRPETGDYLVDMFFEMSTPIALGSTGLGIYGFRGLIGNGFVAAKEEGETWWEYYRKPKLGINQDKFAAEDGFSIGAGASIATVADSGYTFSSKLFFLASVPRLFLLEGQANILSTRIGLDSTVDPPFYAAILISDESFEAGLGVDYKIPKGGEILDLDATMELAFFYERASAWYINIGRDTPAEKRVRAKVLSLIDMYSYLMISSQGIKAGAGASWDFQKDFSIAKIAFGVAVDVGGQLSFNPVQVGGFLSLVGYASLRVFGIGFRINVSAKLTAEAPKPFIITGSFHVELSLPWPLPDVSATLSFTWQGNTQLNLAEVGILKSAQHDLTAAGSDGAARKALYLESGTKAAQGTHIVTGERMPINYLNRDHTGESDPATIPLPGDNVSASGWVAGFDHFIIPIDTYIDIEFMKGIRYDPSKAANPSSEPPTIAPITAPHTSSELIPPRKGKSAQVKHDYIVTDVRIKYWKPVSRGSTDENQGTWEDYRFEKMDTTLLAIADSNTPNTSWQSLSAETIIRDHAKYGFWQMVDAKAYTKLRLLSRSPLEHAVKISPYNAGVPSQLLLCPPDPIPMQCQDWTLQTGTNYTAGRRISDRDLEFRIVNQDGTVVAFPNVHMITPSLALATNNRIELWFPAPTSRVDLKLSTLADDVTISYYRGYPWTPPPADPEEESGGGSSNETFIDEWEIEQKAGVVPTNADPIWTKLRNLPGWFRDTCGGGLDIESPAGADIVNLLSEFRQTHIYLRQTLGLAEAKYPLDHTFVSAGQWCAEFYEVLTTLIAGYTGSAPISPFLLPNVEQFYADMGVRIEDYRRTVGTGTAPNQSADDFYESWSSLLEAAGLLYDGRSGLPGTVTGAMWRTFEPAIWRLYDDALARIGTDPGDFDLDINPAAGKWTTGERLLAVAGFFAALSLDYVTITSNNAGDTFNPHYNRLERSYLGLIALMSQKEIDAVCGGPDCGYAQKIITISNLLCTQEPNPADSGAIDRIKTLVADSEDLLADLIDLFGWNYPPVATTDLCPRLRRALAIIAVSFSSYNAIPFSLRYQLDRFYEELNDEVLEYLRDTVDLTLPQPDQTTDEVVQNALEVFSCLRCLCRTSHDTSGVEAYLSNPIDVHLQQVALDVIDEQYDVVDSGGGPIAPAAGVAIPQDPAEQTAILFSFFMGAAGRCGTIGAPDTTLMGTLWTEFNAEYSPYATYLSTSGYNHCYYIGGSFAYTWLLTFDPLCELWRRRSELPGTVRTHIDTVIRPIVDSIYDDVCSDMVGGCQAEPNDWDPLHWKLDSLCNYLRTKVLTATDVNGTIQSQIASDLSDLSTESAALKSIPEFADVDIWGELSFDMLGVLEQCIRAFTDIKLEQMTATPPWPSTGLTQVVSDFEDDLNSITASLGIEDVSLSGLGFDYSATLGEVMRVLVLAQGSLDRLPLSQVAAIRGFLEALWDEYLSFFQQSYAPTPGSCADVSFTWVNALLCLMRATRYSGLVSNADDEFDTRFVDSGLLRSMLGKVLTVADKAGMDIVPGRSVSTRCDRVRMLLNFFTVRSLDYSSITTQWLDDVFAERQSLFDDFDATELESIRALVCSPVPGPYDPLMKRETLTRNDLLRGIAYNDPSKPVDRIVIESNTSCDTNPPFGWLDTYWNDLRNYVTNTLIPEITTEKGAAQTALDALGPKASSQLAIDYEEQIAELQEGLDNASAFLAAISTNPVDQFDPCSIFIHEVCWLPQQAYDYNLGLPGMHDVRTSVHGMDISMNLVTQPLWRPNTTYAVQIETLEMVQGKEYRRYHTYGFRTAGPLGHYHDTGTPGTPNYQPDYAELVDQNRPEAYKYADLRHYVDFRRSYPGPDGNLIGAKPLYTLEPQVNLYYTQDYLRSMFSIWDWGADWGTEEAPMNAAFAQLELVILDQADGSEIERLALEWTDDPDPREVEATRKFTNIVKNLEQDGKACVQVTPVETPPAYTTKLKNDEHIPALEENSLYTVSLQARFGEVPYDGQGVADVTDTQSIGFVREVLRYVFRTSRYGDFTSHINSHILSADPGNEVYAFYSRTIPDADVATAAGVLDGGEDIIRSRYAIDYDRVVQGALELFDLPAAETMEFTVLRKESTGDAVAILVRSPEPINDPRLPIGELEEGLKGTNPGDELKVYFSKDASSALVTRDPATLAPMTLPAGPISLTFSYRQYDGENYAVAKTNSGADVPPVTVVIPTT